MNSLVRMGLRWENFKGGVRSLFGGATTPSSSADWNPVVENRNQKVGSSFAKVTARVDKLIDDFPYINNVQAINTSYVVGEGIRFNSRIINEDGNVGVTEKRQRQQIEDAIAWASEELDIAFRPGISSGAMESWELQRLSCDRRIATGESCFIIHHDTTPGRYIPFALQATSTTNLTEWGATPHAGNLIYRGIEYQPMSGKIMAFHFDDSALDTTGLNSTGLGTVRVEAQYVIFDKMSKHPGQMRGISPLAASVLVAHDFEDVFNSEIDAAKMTAKFLGTVTTPDAAEFMRRNAVALNEGGTKYQQEVQNSLMQFIKNGEKVEWTTPTRPSNILLPFTEVILRMIASNIQLPYELIAQNFTGMNYTVTRASRAHLQKMIQPKMKYQITHVNRPITKNIIQSAVLTGRLELPGYWQNPRYYERGVYQLPGLEPVDPFRQAKADAENLANMITSPQEVCARRGVEYEEVVEQYEAATQILEDNGFDAELFVEMMASKSSTNTQSNGNASADRSEMESAEHEFDKLDTI